MTATHETPMSLFSHNKCGKVTTIKHCMEAGLIFYFTFYLFGGCVHTQPYGPAGEPETRGAGTVSCQCGETFLQNIIRHAPKNSF